MTQKLSTYPQPTKGPRWGMPQRMCSGPSSHELRLTNILLSVNRVSRDMIHSIIPSKCPTATHPRQGLLLHNHVNVSDPLRQLLIPTSALQRQVLAFHAVGPVGAVSRSFRNLSPHCFVDPKLSRVLILRQAADEITTSNYVPTVGSSPNAGRRWPSH